MNESEVIYRLKQHLKRRRVDNGYLCRTDKAYCLNYVMDFLNLNKTQAKEFLINNIPAIAGLM